MLTGFLINSLSQPLQAIYSQTDYEEYIIMENADQRINQQNTGSGSSTNINCGTNTAGTNLAQPITCPSVPGETPTSVKKFVTTIVSNTVPIDAVMSAIAEVSCPEGTEVTGGGYDIPSDAIVTRIDAPTDNGWKVSVSTGGPPGISLTVYAVCGTLVEPT
jgi:hypothetical protein